MIAKLLKKVFDLYYIFPDQFWKGIEELGIVEVLDKETTIKEPYHIEKNLSLVIEGSGGILLWNNNNFVCTDIVLKNDFISDYLSFISRQETPYEVVTFEKPELFTVTYDFGIPSYF